jgi:2-C-methyl-D-erythritol 2,4-cyclodiphosphate synthase
LTHAVIDALLGAAGLGDIGRHFPETDSKYEGASSLDLLESVVRMLRDGSFQVVNVDCTVIAEEPRLQLHLGAMRAHLAKALDVELNAVNVKATSPEGLGALGRKDGIAAQAVALIEATG